MEVFRDLVVNADEGQMAVLVASIERSLPPGWVRDREAEGRIRDAAFAASPAYCFTCDADGRSASATLVLLARKPGAFLVSNIIPIARDQLSYAEYNTILEDFYKNALRPSVEQSGLSAVLTESQFDLDHWMAPATAEKLRTFSADANKGIGGAHPRDRARWNAFVLSAHQDDSRMSSFILRRWLIEVEGWSPEVADELTMEYEYGRKLLTFVEKNRQSA